MVKLALVIEEWLVKYEMEDLFDKVSNSKFAGSCDYLVTIFVPS